jgi:hypothetical protein
MNMPSSTTDNSLAGDLDMPAVVRRLDARALPHRRNARRKQGGRRGRRAAEQHHILAPFQLIEWHPPLSEPDAAQDTQSQKTSWLAISQPIPAANGAR